MATDKVTYWIEIADYDIGTAEALFKSQRWLYVAFMCHQAIEKTLKAYWCGMREDDPPYTHNHKRLASGCGLYEQMSDEQRKFIETVTITILKPVTQRTKMLFIANSPNKPAAR